MTPKARAVKAALAEFPDAPTQTIARILARDHPLLFNSTEDARDVVRYYRGAVGAKKRGYLADKSHLREPQKPGDPFSDLLDKIPEGDTHFKDWKALEIQGPINALILSDLHIPYHVKDPIVEALKDGKHANVDTIILNGDTADCFSVSFWEKDPEKRNFQHELDILTEFLKTLRECFPKARIIMKAGNHEERHQRYMRVKCPELLGVPEFEVDSLFKLKELGIEWVPDMRPIRMGMLNVIHGHEFRWMISNPVNPARGYFLRAKTHCLGAHFHQTSQHSEKDLEGKVVSTWSTGCLCDLHPDYRPINNWNHGFARVEVAKNGTFNVENLKWIEGEIYH